MESAISWPAAAAGEAAATWPRPPRWALPDRLGDVAGVCLLEQQLRVEDRRAELQGLAHDG